MPSLSTVLGRLVIGLETLSTASQSLAAEADAQSKLTSDFGHNQAVRQFLTTRAIPKRINLQHSSVSKVGLIESQKGPRRRNSLYGVGLANSNTSCPSSPKIQRLSRGIDEEQAEDETSFDYSTQDTSTELTSSASGQKLHPSSFTSAGSVETADRVSIESSKRTSLAAASVWSRRTSSSAKSEKSLDYLVNFKGQPLDLPSLSNDGDRPTSGSSRSPTRSRKLAKFFGEDAASQIIGAQPPSVKPAFLMPDYGVEDISFNVDNQVRGGTLRGLVIKLTSHEGPDVPFLRVFLMTYRTFTTSHDFLDLLFERYHQQPPPDLTTDELKMWSDQKQKVIKIRVVNVMRTWIESHLSDEDAEGILQRITEFAARDMGDSSLSKQITLTCERRVSYQSRGPSSKLLPVPSGNPPPTIVPRNTRKIKFLDIDPLELARQLSLVESKLFCQIQVNECLGKAWPKEFAKEGTPHITAMIDMSNALTRWVAETILSQPEQKKRANTIKHFILIAERCRNLNNFSTLMQIIAGLNSTPIYRLRRTWETIPHKILTLFGQLGAVMSPTKNYATYRDTIRNMAPPCVPFVGVYLTDWTFIGDGNPDNLREKPHQINFNKRQKAAELIVQIQSYQSMPYQLTPVPVIVKFLEESLDNPLDEKELYDMSLDIEPRERDDEKIARLLAEVGFDSQIPND
ncbi:ras guanine nucleotide exchange factor domain-containing protein [Melampsora americana]|nr:ras guanine nucleotide exchange factor domain-containing protein [Melampsora americana]